MAQDAAAFGPIMNEDELEAWLDSVGDHRVLSAFAARNALRCLPAALSEIDVEEGGYRGVVLTVAVLRASLISGVAGTWPTPEMSESLLDRAFSANSAANPAATSAVVNSGNSAAFSANSAANSAFSANSAAANSATFSGFSANSAGVSATSAAFSAANSVAPSARAAANSATASAAYLDGEHLQNAEPLGLFRTPLWPEGNPVPEWERAWADFQSRSQTDSNWVFWVKWYRSMLNGQPLDWDLQRRIALEIADDEWDEGPSTVAQRIAEIEASYLISKTELAEDVYYNEETARGARRYAPPAKPVTLTTMLAALREDLDEASTGNLLSQSSYDYRTLDRMMTKYHGNPERVEMDVVKISKSLRRQIDRKDLPDAPEVEGLCDQLVEIGIEIRAQHPDIREAREARAAEMMRTASEEEKEAMLAGIGMIRSITEEEFADEIAEDIEEVIAQSNDPSIERQDPDAASRTGNRLAKLWIVVRNVVVAGVTGLGALVTASEALPILQSLWQIFARLLGFG